MAESAPQLPENDIEAAPQQSVQDENAPTDGGKRSTRDKYEGQTYEQRLYRYATSGWADREWATSEWAPKSPICLVDFHELSRVNCTHLMNELAKYDQTMVKGKAAPQDIEHVGDLLHRYTTAVQDSEYWSKLPPTRSFWMEQLYHELLLGFPSTYRDWGESRMTYSVQLPKSTGPIDPLRDFLKRVLFRLHTWTYYGRRPRSSDDFWSRTDPGHLPPFVDTIARFIVAITGGLSLVIPMLVMRLGETLPKSLTTVSVAVILFSALTSLMFKASNVETLAATAAYAAVLVVFVGTSS